MRVVSGENAPRAQPGGERLARHVPITKYMSPSPRRTYRAARFRMSQSGGGTRLLAEALAHLRGAGLLGRKDLDRDVAVERELVCEVDRTHPAAAEQPFDAILEADRLLERVAQRVGDRIGCGLHACAALKAEPRLGRKDSSALAAFH